MKPTLGLLLLLLPLLAVGCGELGGGDLKIPTGNQVVQYDVDGMT